ncbi:MAG: hypothetical protein MPN21_08580 [Thermoanaerobaculia bacterium]|nr:hypothetical protein [Thermoanaerobaculia bacterium]
MGREIDISRNILAPADTVWELLEKPVTWKSWWPECENARILDRGALREGSSIEVTLRPDARTIDLLPTVDLFTMGKTLSLTHRSWALAATASFYLSAKDSGTHVRVQAVVEGLGVLYASLTGNGTLPLQLLDSALRGLKRTAERLG